MATVKIKTSDGYDEYPSAVAATLLPSGVLVVVHTEGEPAVHYSPAAWHSFSEGRL